MFSFKGTREQWQQVFWLTAGILVGGTAFFVVFASGEVQPWAKMNDEDPDAKELNVLRVAADDEDASRAAAAKAPLESDVGAPLV